METKYYKREGRRFVRVDLSQLAVDNAGKYYQNDGGFCDVRTIDSIGLCISSSVTEHVIMALHDCPGEYTLGEAIAAAKKFHPCGEIPTEIEMMTAFKFRSKLNLLLHENYRVCVSGGSANAGARDGLIYFYVDDDSSGAYARIGGLCSNAKAYLRPVLRIKHV